MPTIKEVSELAQVSQATVSRVMNGSDRVTDATKRRVMEAMASLGYRPNSAAQSLASHRTNSIGMVVSELQGLFYGPMMSGVENVLRKAHKHLIIAAGHGDKDTEREAIEFLVGRQVDGLILLVETIDDDYLVELDERVPIFLINHHIQGLHERTIRLDNELGGYRATRFLLGQGHTRIACITGQQWKQDNRERLDGYYRAMAEAGIDVPEDWIVHSNFELQGGFEAFETLVARQNDCTAIFALNDDMAFGVLEACRRHDVQVPEDVSVIGFDNVLTANYVHPKLTTMDFPIFEMAQGAAQMALDTIYRKIATEGTTFEPRLVERQTVRRFHAGRH